MSYYEYGKTEEYLLSLLPEYVVPKLAPVLKEAQKFGVPTLSNTGARFLELVTMLKKPKRILEIGTATGYSGLIMLLSCNAKLCTIDFDAAALDRARRNFDDYGVGRRVQILEGDASEIIPLVEGKFDMIFLDGPKGRYYEFLPYLIDLLPSGGVLLCDNVLYSERMTGEREVPKSKQTIADRLAIFIDNVTTDSRLVTSVLPIGDGMSISVKR